MGCFVLCQAPVWVLSPAKRTDSARMKSSLNANFMIASEPELWGFKGLAAVGDSVPNLPAPFGGHLSQASWVAPNGGLFGNTIGQN